MKAKPLNNESFTQLVNGCVKLLQAAGVPPEQSTVVLMSVAGTIRIEVLKQTPLESVNELLAEALRMRANRELTQAKE